MIIMLFLLVSAPLHAGEPWILTCSLELPWFADTFSPGLSFRADALLFRWNPESPDEDDGYGITMEGGLLFPVSGRNEGLSPYVRLGAVGKGNLDATCGLTARGGVMYALTHNELPGNGLGGSISGYLQNIGLFLSSDITWMYSHRFGLSAGLGCALLFPLQHAGGKRGAPLFMAAISCGISLMP